MMEQRFYREQDASATTLARRLAFDKTVRCHVN